MNHLTTLDNTKNKGHGFTMLGLSLTIVRNSQGKYVCINEVKNRGWWIPGGRVDPPENFFVAAKRYLFNKIYNIPILIKNKL